MQKIKISFITTINHNIGDDFVREGLKFILRQVFNGYEIIFENVNKHFPVTSRYGYEDVTSLRESNEIDNKLPLLPERDRLMNADIVIQSGAPVYWCHEGKGTHCYENEWYTPLITNRLISKRTNIINLAAGSCQKYHSDGTEFCKLCNDYIREFYSRCSLTTVRDRVAQTILNLTGIETDVIACSSIFAIDEYGYESGGEEYIVLNYMHGGAHYLFGQDIDLLKWEKAFKTFYDEIKKTEKVILVCHDQKEYDNAIKIDPNGEIFYKKNDFLAYMRLYSCAKFGIVNRVHASFMLASFGKPSVVIGNDTRATMVSEIGLQSFYVGDVTYERLVEFYNKLKNDNGTFKKCFKRIKDEAYSEYIKKLSFLKQSK